MSALCQKRTHALQQLMPNLREAVPIATCQVNIGLDKNRFPPPWSIEQ